MIATTPDAETVKLQADGRWLDILPALGGIDHALLDGKHHPCPKCGGTDRFRIIDKERGALFCGQCFDKQNGDGLAALQWLTGLQFPEVVRMVADYVGTGQTSQAIDPLTLVARQKRVKPESFKAYGAEIQAGAVVFPCYGPTGERCSTFSLWPNNGKGKFAKDKKAGLFFPTLDNQPQHPLPDETWLFVEGVKDAAAGHGLGFKVCGLNRNVMSPKFARLFRGVHVVIVPDRDAAGESGAQKTARALHGIAASIRVATLPVEFKETEGQDVRDVLALPDGENQLRLAIQDSATWEPEKITDAVALHLLATEGRTDAANAQRFKEKYGADVRWCDAHGRWYVFVGTHWQQDRKREVELMMGLLAADLWAEVKRLSADKEIDRDAIEQVVKFAKASNSANGIRNALAIAKSLLPVLPEQFDADNFALNCPNGTLDLHSGELHPHSRNDYLTKLCPTPYVPAATCPTFEEFLKKIYGYEVELIDFERRYSGYCLTGDVSEQIVRIDHGGGANGKSTLINCKTSVVGTDYTMQAPRGFLMSQKNDRHLTEQYDLRGKRFVAAVETGSGQRMDEELFKSLSGGESIRARKLYADHEEFQPTHKLAIATNHEPRIRGTDHAVWRRVVKVPFNVTFWNRAKGETGLPELEQDKGLPAKLAAEAEGILAWMVRGCTEWQENGLAMPGAVLAATDGYRVNQDTVGRFVAECCIACEGATPFKALYEAMEQWAKDTGENPPSRKAMAQWLESKGYERGMSRTRPYRGIGLLTGARNDCNDVTTF